MSVTDKAVILARGLGTRMRRPEASVTLDSQQSAAADAGFKAMMPVGRPFLDYVLSALADAGYRRVCLVVGPEHGAIRDEYARKAKRLELSFAVQQKPLGTADAVASAAEFAGRDLFLVINSDNYYPPAAMAALRDLSGPGLIGFEREALVRDGAIPEERIARFALIEADPDGWLTRIVEKPGAEALAAFGADARISMNCWLFSERIFDSCGRIDLSPRGEYELADAVLDSMKRHGERYRVLPMAAPVLDLSSRADIATVAERLRGVEVRL